MLIAVRTKSIRLPHGIAHSSSTIHDAYHEGAAPASKTKRHCSLLNDRFGDEAKTTEATDVFFYLSSKLFKRH
jgi:hypothetical protein